MHNLSLSMKLRKHPLSQRFRLDFLLILIFSFSLIQMISMLHAWTLNSDDLFARFSLVLYKLFFYLRYCKLSKVIRSNDVSSAEIPV